MEVVWNQKYQQSIRKLTPNTYTMLYSAETDLPMDSVVNLVSNQTSDISDATPVVESNQGDSKQTTEAEIIMPENEDFIRMLQRN